MFLGKTRVLEVLSYTTLGFAIRIIAIQYGKDIASARTEVTTPISEWRRAKEAVFLWQSDLNPYLGNVFHEYPISLQLYKFILNHFRIDLTLSIIDTITAILLFLSSKKQLSLSNLNDSQIYSKCRTIFLIYLFSPITLLSCVGLSTSTFTNFLMALILTSQSSRYLKAFTCFLCALLTCNNIHYSTLVLPVFLTIEYYSSIIKCETELTNRIYYHKNSFKSSLYSSVILYIASLLVLLTASYLLMGQSWTFLRAVYLFSLKITDLRPNIGMFWYFFTEMFDQFLEFFTWVVQINAFIHFVPVSIYLKDDPFFLQYMILLTSTIFQPYPSMSSVGLILSLLPMWSKQLSVTKHGVVVASAAITCMSLWPIFWHLWIVLGTANSNFYFGATLAFTLSAILLMVDLFNSHGYINAMKKLEEYKSLHNLPDKSESTETTH